MTWEWKEREIGEIESPLRGWVLSSNTSLPSNKDNNSRDKRREMETYPHPPWERSLIQSVL
jgi:hypothetical protein